MKYRIDPNINVKLRQLREQEAEIEEAREREEERRITEISKIVHRTFINCIDYIRERLPNDKKKQEYLAKEVSKMLAKAQPFGFMGDDESELMSFSKDFIEIIIMITETKTDIGYMRRDPREAMSFIMDIREEL